MNENRGSPALPPGWVSAYLSDVAHIIMGQSPPSSTYNTEGVGLPFFQGKAEFGELYPSTRKWCSEPKKVADAEDVLISVRAPVGPTNLCPEKACIGRGLAAIRGLGGAEARYLLYLLRAFESRIAEQGTGTTFAAISGADLRSLEVPVCPLPEQRRIVAKIEELFTRLDAGVEALKRVQALLERYRQSVLKAAFEGRLSAAWREAHRDELEPASVLLERTHREREPAEPNKGRRKRSRKILPLSTSALPDLPEEWVWTKLAHVTCFSQNGCSKRRSTEGEPTVVLRLSDIRESRFEYGSVRRIALTAEQIAGYSLQDLDLLCVRVNGSPDLVGRMVQFRSAGLPVAFCDHFIRLRCSKGVNSSFVQAFFDTSQARDYIRAHMVSSAGQNTVSQTTMLNVPIPLPPRREQDWIVSEIERHNAVIGETAGSVRGAHRMAARLRGSILSQAFQGRLVPQDPTDEPAEVLLARIRAARQEQGRLL